VTEIDSVSEKFCHSFPSVGESSGKRGNLWVLWLIEHYTCLRPKSARWTIIRCLWFL